MFKCITAHKFSPILVTTTCQQASISISHSRLAQKILRGPTWQVPFCSSLLAVFLPAHIHRTPAQPVALHKPQGLGLLASGGISLSIARTREVHEGRQGRRAAPVAPWRLGARDYPCCWHQWQMRRWRLWPLLKILFLCALLPTVLTLTPALARACARLPFSWFPMILRHLPVGQHLIGRLWLRWGTRAPFHA
jgi:hypothetical protein